MREHRSREVSSAAQATPCARRPCSGCPLNPSSRRCARRPPGTAPRRAARTPAAPRRWRAASSHDQRARLGERQELLVEHALLLGRPGPLALLRRQRGRGVRHERVGGVEALPCALVRAQQLRRHLRARARPGRQGRFRCRAAHCAPGDLRPACSAPVAPRRHRAARKRAQRACVCGHSRSGRVCSDAVGMGARGAHASWTVGCSHGTSLNSPTVLTAAVTLYAPHLLMPTLNLAERRGAAGARALHMAFISSTACSCSTTCSSS